MNGALTNAEARRRHLPLPYKIRGKCHFRRGRGQSLADQRYARQKKHKLNEVISAIKLERGCESQCCPVKGELFAQELAFHHCVGKKEIAVSEITSLPAALREIEKCLVLCHICHSRVHHQQLDLSKVILAKWPDYTPNKEPIDDTDDQLQLFDV